MFYSLCLAMAFCFTHSRSQSSKFFVYRAESTGSPYKTHLENANAANAAGVLSYLHTEVIPKDVGSGQLNNCERKGGVDLIYKFEITVLNPLPLETPPVSGFMAYDSGKCSPENCQEIYNQQGYYVGAQSEATNPRAAYTDGTWYSFPQPGLCSNPDGTHNCSYTARPIGMILIDDLVNVINQTIIPDYHTWCEANPANIEMERIEGAPEYNCPIQTQSVDFWKDLCDAAACQTRIDQLSQIVFNTTLVNGCDGVLGNSYLYESQCMYSCPPGTYVDWDYVCQPCPSDLHCQDCNWVLSPDGKGGDHCTSCGGEYPFLFSDGGCASSCPDNYYPSVGNLTETECIKCDASCWNCTGPSNTTCTSCHPNMVFSDGTCSSCPPNTVFEGNSCKTTTSPIKKSMVPIALACAAAAWCIGLGIFYYFKKKHAHDDQYFAKM